MLIIAVELRAYELKSLRVHLLASLADTLLEVLEPPNLPRLFKLAEEEPKHEQPALAEVPCLGLYSIFHNCWRHRYISIVCKQQFP